MLNVASRKDAGFYAGEFAGSGCGRGPPRRDEGGRTVTMSVEQDRLTVLCDDIGYRTLSLQAVQGYDLHQPGQAS